MNKVISIFLLVLLSVYLSGQDVAQWRGSDRNGIYNETGLLKNGRMQGQSFFGILMS
jgi:hypothetical protein